MSIVQTATRRHAAKAFDRQRPLSAAQIQALKDILRLSPSSINYQGWHFLLISSAAAREKLCQSCHDHFAYNAQKVRDAGLVVVLCAQTAVSINHAKTMLAQEFADGRFANETVKAEREALICGNLDKLKQDPQQAQIWLDKQVYIALGQVLLAAADMGIDSVAVEGFDKAVVDDVFDLPAQGLHAVVMAAFGYHSEADFNAALPKSRLPETALFTAL